MLKLSVILIPGHYEKSSISGICFFYFTSFIPFLKPYFYLNMLLIA